MSQFYSPDTYKSFIIKNNLGNTDNTYPLILHESILLPETSKRKKIIDMFTSEIHTYISTPPQGPPMTENKAYRLAKKGKIFTWDIGNMTRKELNLITTIKPTVHHSKWKKAYTSYNSNDIDDLKSMSPEAVDLVPDVTKEEILIYTVNGKTPRGKNNEFKRWKTYDQLLILAKNLMNKLHNLEDVKKKHYAFSHKQEHFLEDYILEFNKSYGLSESIMVLSDRLGLDIQTYLNFGDVDPEEAFFRRFYNDLDELKDRDDL